MKRFGYQTVEEYSKFDLEKQRRKVSPFPPGSKRDCLEGVRFFVDMEVLRQKSFKGNRSEVVILDRSFLAILSYLFATQTERMQSCLFEAIEYYIRMFDTGVLRPPDKMIIIKYRDEALFQTRSMEKIGSLPFFLQWSTTMSIQKFLECFIKPLQPGVVLTLYAEAGLEENIQQTVRFINTSSSKDWLTKSLNKLLDIRA